MGNRLSSIATRTGDDGSTGLGDNTRVPKNHLRMMAMGDVDELNSSIGLLLTETLPADISVVLNSVQHELFNVGGELCMPGYSLIKEEAVLGLDKALKHYNQSLAPLKEFILPGGSRAASLAHIARSIARRAERSVVSVGQSESVSVHLRQYLNRLSDLLFVLARVLNQAQGVSDVYWQSTRLQAQTQAEG